MIQFSSVSKEIQTTGKDLFPDTRIKMNAKSYVTNGNWKVKG